ncbi:MAG: restriction endonuclease [Planctomycetota bacterium]
MGLSQSQKTLIEKARVLGSGSDHFTLDRETCSYLVGVIAEDLGLLDQFPEIGRGVPGFYSTDAIEALRIDVDFSTVVGRLFDADENADTYFSCLANFHKRRLKYQRILRTQPLPTIEQVGPRGLLQFGSLSPRALTALLLWRKWIYDIDNRAAQETGYLFEPIIAHAIGGAPVSAKQSPVKREGDKKKGRQVDCIVEQRAYEFKMRVTIAASGQGRWGEELQFPKECRLSGYTPVLVVLDPTPNPKLDDLTKAFLAEKGEVYAGDEAWKHLDDMAGPTMSRFLENYVRGPIESLLAEANQTLPDLYMSLADHTITVSLGNEKLVIPRTPDTSIYEADELPDDADDQLPGV